MISFNVNWLAVIICAVANMMIGAGWYGFFAEPWMAGIGKTREDIEADSSSTPYVIAGLNSFLMAFVLANVIQWTGATGWLNGLLTGALMWLGFTGLAFGANHAFEFRDFKAWGINAGTYFLGLMVMGAIIGAFG